MQIENAVIESAIISKKDHGVLTVWLILNYGGSGQGFGGWSLYSPRMTDGLAFAGKFIWRCMEIAGVEDWKDMVGKPVRVRRQDGWGAAIEAIGHFIKDDWFDPVKEHTG